MPTRTTIARLTFAFALGLVSPSCSRAVAASVPVSTPAGAVCPAELHPLAHDPGFRSETPGSTLDPDDGLRSALQGTVTAVGASGLDLLTASGVTRHFNWTGPALPFVNGERVTFERADGWDSVRNARFVASAFRYATEATQPTPPSDVRDGPGFQFSEACVVPEPRRCAPGSPARRSFALDVTVNQQTAHVQPGSTVTVAGWQVTNIASETTSTCACSSNCPGSFRAAAQVTILGPIAH